jgi:hypothetical protein
MRTSVLIVWAFVVALCVGELFPLLRALIFLISFNKYFFIPLIYVNINLIYYYGICRISYKGTL